MNSIKSLIIREIKSKPLNKPKLNTHPSLKTIKRNNKNYTINKPIIPPLLLIYKSKLKPIPFKLKNSISKYHKSSKKSINRISNSKSTKNYTKSNIKLYKCTNNKLNLPNKKPKLNGINSRLIIKTKSNHYNIKLASYKLSIPMIVDSK